MQDSTTAVSLLLLHAEVVIADILDGLVVEHSLERQLILICGKRAGRNIERDGVSCSYAAPGKTAESHNLGAAQRAQLRAKSWVVVPCFELDFDVRDLDGRIQHQLLASGFCAGKSRQQHE